MNWFRCNVKISIHSLTINVVIFFQDLIAALYFPGAVPFFPDGLPSILKPFSRPMWLVSDSASLNMSIQVGVKFLMADRGACYRLVIYLIALYAGLGNDARHFHIVGGNSQPAARRRLVDWG